MQLHGRLASIRGNELTFKDDLKANLDYADSVAESIKETIDKYIAEAQLDAPTDPVYEPSCHPTGPSASLDVTETGIKSVIWCTGYHMDFSWIDVPAFDGKGYPGHDRGVSEVEGLYFLGLPWLYTWGSGRFSGVARDAEYLADCIALKNRVLSRSSSLTVNEMALGS